MVDPPIFTGTSVEGTTTLFETEYFGQKAYLSQSGQLHMEAAAMALRQGLLLRSDIPSREIQDTTACHGVLDARTGGCLCCPR